MGEEEPAGEVDDGSEWAAFGIHNDEDLRNAEVRTEWIYNSWYEVYEVTPDGNHGYKGEVFHEHKEAVEYIVGILRGYLPGTTVNVHSNGVIELDPSNPKATVCGACGRGWDDEVSTALTPVPADVLDPRAPMPSVDLKTFVYLCEQPPPNVVVQKKK